MCYQCDNDNSDAQVSPSADVLSSESDNTMMSLGTLLKTSYQQDNDVPKCCTAKAASAMRYQRDSDKIKLPRIVLQMLQQAIAIAMTCCTTRRRQCAA